MRERRVNPIGRSVTAEVPRITLGGLRLAVLDLEQTADLMIQALGSHRASDEEINAIKKYLQQFDSPNK